MASKKLQTKVHNELCFAYQIGSALKMTHSPSGGARRHDRGTLLLVCVGTADFCLGDRERCASVFQHVSRPYMPCFKSFTYRNFQRQ